MKNGADPDWSDPTEEQVEEFEALKNALVKPTILELPQRNRPFMTETDSRKYDMGPTLLQHQDSIDPNKWATEGVWRNKLAETEKRYSATESACLSVVWVVRKLQAYIEGKKFVVRSSHNDLRWMMDLNDPHGRLVRCRLPL